MQESSELSVNRMQLSVALNHIHNRQIKSCKMLAKMLNFVYTKISQTQIVYRQLSFISAIEFEWMLVAVENRFYHAHCIYNVSGCCSCIMYVDIVLFVNAGTYAMNG